MKDLLPTTEVTISTSVAGPPDSYGNSTDIWTDEVVPGCLVAPYSSTDIKAPFELLDETRITVHIPTRYSNSLRNARITYSNRTFKVTGDPVPYVWSPLPWNRKVICEEILNG